MAEWEQSAEVKQLEDELRSGLRHVPPPDGFAERVMQRLDGRVDRREDQRAKPRPVQRASRFFLGVPARNAWLTIAAATLVLAVGGGDMLHVRQQRRAREATAAQAQVDLAMQLTNHALAQVEMGLDHSPAGRYTHFLGTR